GSLAPELREVISRERPLSGLRGGLRVYVSFGSVIWWYYASVASAAMVSLADALSEREAEVLVSLGNYAPAEAERRRIERANVRVVSYVDQWGALKDADLFVTHQGLNSTHEAIFHRVPMLSHPFFGDQPALARRCQALGLAVPVSDGLRAALER